MQTNLPAVVTEHGATIKALRGKSNRVDVYVQHPSPTAPMEADGWVRAFREFLDGMDQETDKYVNDPIATSQALARMEAILADMRYVRDRLRDVTASSMNRFGVRKLVVEGVSVTESSSIVERKNWQHGKLLADMLAERGIVKMIDANGEVVDIADVMTELGDALYGPSTSPRLTPIKNAGLKVEDYCDIAEDEEGKPVRKPTVSIPHNEVRKRR